MFEVLVGNGVGLGVAFGVDVGNGSEIALPEMVNIIISPSVIRSEPTEPICIDKSQLSVTELYVVKNPLVFWVELPWLLLIGEPFIA